MPGFNKTRTLPIFYALLAALLYGLSSPLSKILLVTLPPTLLAALLYLGAGLGMVVLNTTMTKAAPKEAKLTKKEVPLIIGMILLDILALVLLMSGLMLTQAANASLLNNFEIVATTLIALVVFKETIDTKMMIAIALITLSSILLTVTDLSAFSFSFGSILIIGACLAWGLENNVTRVLSIKDPVQIVIIKGFGSGFGALILSLLLKETSQAWIEMGLALILGCFAYGFSITFYIKSQRYLGAARTSAYYAVAPFIGVLISWVFLKETLSRTFLVALLIMIIGTIMLSLEKHQHLHTHDPLTHTHLHSHDEHHHHPHEEVISEHTHPHTHEALVHDHDHSPDLHHHHPHKKKS